jgi:hypothetical protein
MNFWISEIVCMFLISSGSKRLRERCGSRRLQGAQWLKLWLKAPAGRPVAQALWLEAPTGRPEAPADFFDFWISGFWGSLDFWISGFLDFWISGFLDFWISGFLDF